MTEGPILTTAEAPAPTPEQARARIEELRPILGQPYHDRALDDEHERLVRLAYAAPPPVPPDPKGLVEQREARLETLWAELMRLEDGSPEHRRRLAEYEGLIRTKWPELEAADAESPADMPSSQDQLATVQMVQEYNVTLPEGETFNEATVAALIAPARERFGDGAPEAMQSGLLAVGAALSDITETGIRPTLDAAVTWARTAWGDAYDDQLDAASTLWDALPAPVQRQLTARGVRYHPAFLRWAADWGAQEAAR
jgi:hypothetical protein